MSKRILAYEFNCAKLLFVLDIEKNISNKRIKHAGSRK